MRFIPKQSSAKKDINELAKLIVDQATGEQSEGPVDEGENPAAVALGGLKGSKARAAKLAKAPRSEIAKKAGEPRWHIPCRPRRNRPAPLSF